MNLLKNLFTTWIRRPGSAEDVWEAHTALERLEEIARRENAEFEREAARLTLTPHERAACRRPESGDFIQANANVAEAMSYISAWQEWDVRAAVAAGDPPPELLDLEG